MYDRTTVSVDQLLGVGRHGRRRAYEPSWSAIAGLVALVAWLLAALTGRRR